MPVLKVLQNKRINRGRKQKDWMFNKHRVRYALRKIKNKQIITHFNKPSPYRRYYRNRFWRHIIQSVRVIRSRFRRKLWWPHLVRIWRLQLRFQRLPSGHLLINPNRLFNQLSPVDWKLLFSNSIKPFLRLKASRRTYKSLYKRWRLLILLGKLRAYQYDPRFTIGTRLAKTKQWSWSVPSRHYWWTAWTTIPAIKTRYRYLKRRTTQVFAPLRRSHYRAKFLNESRSGATIARFQKSRWINFINRYNYNVTHYRKVVFTSPDSKVALINNKLRPQVRQKPLSAIRTYRKRNQLFYTKLEFWWDLAWYFFKKLNKRRTVWFRLVPKQRVRVKVRPPWWFWWGRYKHSKRRNLARMILPTYHLWYFFRPAFRRKRLRSFRKYHIRRYSTYRRRIKAYDRARVRYGRSTTEQTLIRGSRFLFRIGYDRYRRRVRYRVPELFAPIKEPEGDGWWEEEQYEVINDNLYSRMDLNYTIKWHRVLSRSKSKWISLYFNRHWRRPIKKFKRYNYRDKWRHCHWSRRRRWFLMHLAELLIQCKAGIKLNRDYRILTLQYIYDQFIMKAGQYDLKSTIVPEQTGWSQKNWVFTRISNMVRDVFYSVMINIWGSSVANDSAYAPIFNFDLQTLVDRAHTEDIPPVVIYTHVRRLFSPHRWFVIRGPRRDKVHVKVVWNRKKHKAEDAEVRWRFEVKRWAFQYARWKRAFKLGYILNKVSRGYRKLKKDAMFFKLFKLYFWYVTRIDELQLVKLWRHARNMFSARFGSPGIQGFMTLFQLRLANFFIFIGLAFDIQTSEALSRSGMIRINSFMKTSPYAYFRLGDMLQINLLQRDYLLKMFSRIYWVKLEVQSAFISFFMVVWELLLFSVLRWPRPYEQLKAGNWLNTRWLRFYIRQIPVRLYRQKKQLSTTYF